MRRCLAALVAWALLAGTAGTAQAATPKAPKTTKTATPSGFAHVVAGQTLPTGKAVLVVHGATSDPAPPRGRTEKLLRYVQNHRGTSKSRLDTPAEAQAWGRETAARGWSGAFVDVTNWTDPASRAVVAAVRSGLGSSKLLVLNGYPFHSGDLKRHRAVVDDALTVADGFQVECAALGDAKMLLSRYADDVVLWLVCGQHDDARWREQFLRHRAGPNQYYGVRLQKLKGGGAQPPKNGTPPKKQAPKSG